MGPVFWNLPVTLQGLISSSSLTVSCTQKMLKHDESKTKRGEYIICHLPYIWWCCKICLSQVLSSGLFLSSFLDTTMVGEEMSLRKRLSKSSENAEGKEGDQRDRSEESLEPRSNGETFTFFFFFSAFLSFLGPLPWHMEVPRLGVSSKL